MPNFWKYAIPLTHSGIFIILPSCGSGPAAFFKKPSENRIAIRIFVGTVWQNLVYLRFGVMNEREKFSVAGRNDVCGDDVAGL